VNAEQFEEYNAKRNHLLDMEHELEALLLEDVLHQKWQPAAQDEHRLGVIQRVRRRLEDAAP
jgi:hypothetical protein